MKNFKKNPDTTSYSALTPRDYANPCCCNCTLWRYDFPCVAATDVIDISPHWTVDSGSWHFNTTATTQTTQWVYHNQSHIYGYTFYNDYDYLRWDMILGGCTYCMEQDVKPTDEPEWHGTPIYRTVPCNCVTTSIQGSGQITWYKEIPDEVNHWEVVIRGTAPAAGVTMTIGIGGQNVEVQFSDNTQIVLGGNSRPFVNFSKTEPVKPGEEYLLCFSCGIDDCESGQYLIRARNSYNDQPGYWYYNNYWFIAGPPDVMGKFAGDPDRTISIGFDGGEGNFSAFQVYRNDLSRPTQYDPQPSQHRIEQKRNCVYNFCSPCAKYPATFNANGSPCCIGVNLQWERGQYYTWYYQLLMKPSGVTNEWKTNLLQYDLEGYVSGSITSRKTIMYFPTLTTDEGSWTFEIKHPVSGNTIYTQTLPIGVDDYRDAREQPKFSGATSDTVLAPYNSLSAQINSYQPYNLIVKANSYQEDCTPAKWTCSPCQQGQWVDSATVTIASGACAGTYTIPINNCGGSLGVPDVWLYHNNDGSGCLEPFPWQTGADWRGFTITVQNPNRVYISTSYGCWNGTSQEGGIELRAEYGTDDFMATTRDCSGSVTLPHVHYNPATGKKEAGLPCTCWANYTGPPPTSITLDLAITPQI